MQAVPPPIPDDDNPYRAPQAELAKPRDALHLATRTQRLGAAVLDNLMVAAIGIGAALLMPLAEDNPNRQIVFVGFVVLAVLALLAVNLAGIYRSGQTLGKRLLGIRVVRSDGERCDFARYIFLRWLAIAVIGAVPLIGPFLALLNVSLIFRENRRCLHDDFADTAVVIA